MHVALTALCVASAPSTGQADTAATPPSSFIHLSRVAVASDSEAASRAGVESLKAGGNAVDAACATALALGVVHPFASGLGGGGFALVYLAGPGQAVALDFRETAPRGLRVPAAGDSSAPPRSGLSVGVPGEPAGLAELVRRFGALPFSRCVEPALRLARGFPASPWLVQQIKDELSHHPASGPGLLSEVFDLRGRAAGDIRAGEQLSRPRLAKTLEKLRTGGAEAFYKGDIARAIAAAATAAGSRLTLDDLARYRPVQRAPLETKFLGRRILLMPPPSAGGVILAQALGIVSNHVAAWRRAPDPLSPDYLHLLAEALKHGFADRARFLGDPAFAALPMQHLLDPAYHRELSLRLRPDRVLAHDAYGTPSPRPPLPARDGGTAHVSVVDQAGNAVALTTTLNLEFGAGIVAGETGVVLNDTLDDFTAWPGRPDVFALSGGEANQPAGGKRPLSSMSPTIVLGERGVEMVAGAAGGPRIVSATLQVVLDVLLFGRDAQQAVAAPRIHHQWEPDVLYHEPGLPAATVRALAKKGQRTEMRADVGKANAIVRSRSGLDAAADPRAGGMPAGY
jgi:gamma-glutamyltranspeptidase/glutathione hydrolase